MKALGALLLLLMPATCISRTDPVKDTGLNVQQLGLPQAVEGFSLADLYSSNREQATAAYKDCMQHGSACQIPCSSIKHCVGCHPESLGADTAVCAYCLPGFKMSQDRTNCQTCPLGFTSKVGVSGVGPCSEDDCCGGWVGRREVSATGLVRVATTFFQLVSGTSLVQAGTLERCYASLAAGDACLADSFYLCCDSLITHLPQAM
jgi:hypothetical protein